MSKHEISLSYRKPTDTLFFFFLFFPGARDCPCSESWLLSCTTPSMLVFKVHFCSYTRIPGSLRYASLYGIQRWVNGELWTPTPEASGSLAGADARSRHKSRCVDQECHAKWGMHSSCQQLGVREGSKEGFSPSHLKNFHFFNREWTVEAEARSSWSQGAWCWGGLGQWHWV